MITFGYKNKFSGVMRALAAIAIGLVMVCSTEATTNVVKIIAAFLFAAGLVSFAYGLAHKMSVCEFQNNKLKRLDLRGCVAIDELHISDNADLAYVSFYGCTALRYVDCRRTSVSTLDFSGNEKMNFLFATECPLLKTIYIRAGANYSSLAFDEATTKVFEKDPESYSDVKTDNWGDEDIDPWGK